MIETPDELHPTAWAALRALRAGVRLSRNRHFPLFADARFRKALRLHRYLRSVAKDVESSPDQLRVEVQDEGLGTWKLRIEMPTLHGRRVAHLTAFELQLLAEDAPSVALLLAERAGKA
ncbi:MAG: hypothetical protein EXR76_15200 [Myxococcales bacterium]|nr:hypothetical protein [Myxococcales bacterium]